MYFLHVWWARRPLTVSRAAILASLLPAYPTGDDDTVRAWPQKFLKRFPTFDAYKQWFLKLIGIQGIRPQPEDHRLGQDAGNKVDAGDHGKTAEGWNKVRHGSQHPYGYPRAFTFNPNEEQLETLYDLLEWTWGTRDIYVLRPDVRRWKYSIRGASIRSDGSCKRTESGRERDP